MRFLHAADLHIDSPLLGLDRFEGAPIEEIRRAPRDAFRRLIDLALSRNVDFVILAGDIFDGRWRDVGTGLFFLTQLERLEPTPVYVVFGNHDAESTITSSLSWPSHVHRFSATRPQTFELSDLGVALHGQSFAKRAVLEDLAAGYPPPRAGFVNIGVLHTSLGGHSAHETYAPTSLEVLLARGYDAWCLGHVHERAVLSRRPLVLYPGNIQGRHIKERGARGCFIIDDETGTLRERFHPLDSLRWESIDVDATDLTSYEEALAETDSRMDALAEEHGDRRLCLRVSFTGATIANADLRARDEVDDLRAELTRMAGKNAAWIESVRVRTTPLRLLAELRVGGGLVGELLSAFEEVRMPEGALRARLSEALRVLQAKIPGEVASGAYGTKLTEGEGLDRAIEEAEALLRGKIGS